MQTRPPPDAGLPASPATTYQLSAAIELHQHGGTVGDGYLNILAIDVEIT